jgi:hypothetical protein
MTDVVRCARYPGVYLIDGLWEAHIVAWGMHFIAANSKNMKAKTESLLH